MGLYLGSVDSPAKAVTYGPLPDHGFTNLKLVLHTTETAGMPGFNDGKTAPHYVYNPTTRIWTMWAEVEDGRVGTLKGHSVNHGNCSAIQVEILGYSNKNYSPWVGDFTDTNYQDLADFYSWARDRYGVRDAVTPTPATGWVYGASAPTRGTWDQYVAFSGLTAHGWVPGNSHWDPGILDLDRIWQLSQGEEDVDYDKLRQIVKEEVEAALGGKPIVMPDGVRTGNQGVVNSILWAETGDSTIWEQIALAAECGG